MSQQDITQLLHSLTLQSYESMRHDMEIAINDLLQNNFQHLIRILYQVDVDEQKLRKMLELNSGKDAAVVITDMLIRRQLEKIKTRDQLKPGTGIPEDEKW